MNKTRKLEKKWYQYRVRKILSFSLFIAITYFILALSYYFFFKVDSFDFKKMIGVTSDEKLVIDSNSSTLLVAGRKNHELNNTIPLMAVTAKKENLSLTSLEEHILLEPVIPIIDFEKEKQNTTISSSKVRKKKTSKQQGIVHAKPSTYLTAKELSHVAKEDRDTTKLKNIHLHSSSRNYIETMKKKFLKNKSPRDALLLAKAYYVKGYYTESEKWALQANSLDSTLAESWIFFAKAKAKLGKKDEAIGILSTYYKKSKSLKARLLIEKIKNGKI